MKVLFGYIETLQEDNKEILLNTIEILNKQLEHFKSENTKLIEIISKK